MGLLQSPELVPPHELSAFLVIDPDDTVTVRLPHNELGQGTTTALAMLIAEELYCDWSKVKCEYASANRNFRQKNVYGAMFTVGSQGLRTSVTMMQRAGAAARDRLVKAAARHWKCDVAECRCENSVIEHTPSGRKLTYGQVCADAVAIRLDQEPKIKTPDQFTLVGKPTPRLDTQAKIDGSARYGIDAQVQGMVYAAIIQCPVPGGKLKAVDDSAIRGAPGIMQVVKLHDAVAVVADQFWHAKKAVDALKIEWDIGASGKVQQADLDKIYRDGLDGPMASARKAGDVHAALATSGGKLVEALYEAPYQAHVAMEPLNCTVWLQQDKLEVWISTQAPMAVLTGAAKAAGIAPEKTFVHVNFVGGGFGRRGSTDEAIQCVAIAKAVGKPVKLIWTREEDIRHDRYRPQAATRWKARLDEAGRIHALDVKVAVPSLFKGSGGAAPRFPGVEPMAVECIAETAYKIPNFSVGANLINTHVPVSFCRGVGSSQNGFMIEGFIDELAHAAAQDPYRFRRAHLDRADWIGVLDMLAEKSNWGTPMKPGRGRGIAIMECYGTVTGQVAEVTVDSRGKVKVDRMVVVQDCYNAANPNTIEQQMEGGALFGLGQALFGHITFKDGAAQQSNYHDYQVVRMYETPKIETYLHLTGGPRWGGIGEPGVGPTPAAVCNAVFAATGKRVRRLPLSTVDLMQI
ncbi:MAG TPA: molybdopterin cofactor-binding domain-containing protein [Steroidobacteraceae bacterium]|nr:molybdopterin cofactor-binding domain-containing protein [Steroidobacteraceae bacterium]